MANNDTQHPVYFDVFRALHRGALSLWLNRRALLPMTMIPTIVTFLTIMMMRGFQTEDTSTFTLALIKIPSDFVTGLLCALVIYIIMNAPRKGDNDKPKMFVLNVTARKDLLVSAAFLHVVIGYFASGLFAVSEIITAPIQADIQANAEPSVGYEIVILTFLIITLFFYATRLLLLPILVMSKWDIIDFYKHQKSFGLSLPILIIKALTTFAAGLIAIVIVSLLQSPGADADTLSTQPIAMGIIDFCASWLSVIATVWCYASLTVGFRQMTERPVAQ